VSVSLPTPEAPPRTRRALLAGVLGGLGAWAAAAAAKVSPARAAAGSPLIVGSEANSSGTSNTQLIANSSVVTFKLLQNGPGTGLMGYATPTSGATRGVYGRVDSPNGDGVQARNAGTAGAGAALRAYGGSNLGVSATSDTTTAIKGVSAATSGLISAIHGESASFSGRGVSGYATDAFGSATGVYGETAGQAGTGVAGYASHPTEFTYGVTGTATSEKGIGVLGQVYGLTGTVSGVRGNTMSTSGNGVSGWATATSGPTSGVFGTNASIAGTGVKGSATGVSGVTYGVHGRAVSPDGFGVFSAGAVGTDSFVQLQEQGSDPAAPDNTHARLFIRDNGGKTELCVRFASGAVQVISTEP